MSEHRTLRQLHAFVNLVITSGVAIILIFCMLVYGPEIEYHVFPVVKNIELFGLPVTAKDSNVVVITGEKVRNCRKIGYNAISKIGDEYFPSEMISNTHAVDNETPIGKQNFGVWEITPKGDIVAIEAVYQCHNLWDTITPIGIWSR